MCNSQFLEMGGKDLWGDLLKGYCNVNLAIRKHVTIDMAE